MKKLFLFAAAALALTACTSEDDLTLSTAQKTVAQDQAVGFDIYTPAATNVTRAGLEGTMTTSRLQRSEYEGGGFGVYAFQVQDENEDPGFEDATTYVGKNYRTTPIAPNFMANEKILWNATNQGWYYNPLKYWPNETDNDSQDTPASMIGNKTDNHIDRLTFFAYAPYVEKGKISEPGISYITNKNGRLTTGTDVTGEANPSGAVREPSIGYNTALDNPNQAVDLLWGVAPAGGLSYTAVNGKTVNVPEGQPLMDMTKPDVNTNMKFLFQHALARIGVTAVAAVDQVGAGGKLDPNTKITIEKITMTGYFGNSGFLNLDNSIANVANWTDISGVTLTEKKEAIAVTGIELPKTTLTLVAAHPTSGTEAENHQNGTIARHLQFVGTTTANDALSAAAVAQDNRVGVTTVRQNVIMPALIDNGDGANRNWYTSKEYSSGELKYSETTPYYTDPACTSAKLATAKIAANKAVTKNSDGSYTKVDAEVELSYPMELKYYEISDWYTITQADETAGTYDAYTAYHPTTFAPMSSKPSKNDKILLSGMKFVQITDDNKAAYAGKQGYTYNSTSKTYSPKKVGEVLKKDDYVLIGEEQKCAPAFEWTGGTKKAFYKRDANYFMVVPLNNVPNICTKLDADDLKDLYTVRVKIEYYITTEDSKLQGGRAQTKNVIEKDVVFPSIANGKSYNLNLILGLTSVKMEAEVDDWKVINVNANLPQNTAE